MKSTTRGPIKPHFSVACNVSDSECMAQCRAHGAAEVFAGPTSSIFGSGRVRGTDVSLDQVAVHFASARELGMETSLLFNAACTGNTEFSDQGQDEMIEVARFVNENKVSYITVSNPWLATVFKVLCPDSLIKMSSHYNCDNMGKFELLLEYLEVDVVVVSQFANKNFDLLRKVCKRYGPDRLEIMCTVACIPGCPYRTWHASSMAHGDHQPLPDEADSFPCLAEIAAHPQIAIATQFVRREDLQHYMDLGIRRFKIGERFAPNLLNLNCLRYYHGGRESGLWDIIGREFGGKVIRKFHFDRMDGFFDKFVSGDCDGTTYNCDECTHCLEYAKKCIEYQDVEPPKPGFQKHYLSGFAKSLKAKLDR